MTNKRYEKMPELISEDLIKRVEKLSPALICDGMKELGILREGCMDSDLLPIDHSKVMIGTAYTVDTQEGDNFPIHVALSKGKPGYVLVVAGKAYKEKAYIGDLMGATGDALGLKGIVVDGFVRDKLGLLELEMPVFAKGLMQRGPGKKGPGAINNTITCAGVEVNPGDLIFGDCDGVTVVPRDRIEEVLEKAEKKDEYEKQRRKDISEYKNARKGNLPLKDLSPSWVNDMLENLNN